MRHKTDDDIKQELREIRKDSWRLKIEALSNFLDGGTDLLVVAVVLLTVIVVIGNMVVTAFSTP